MELSRRQFSRRQFLAFVGVTGSAAAADALLAPSVLAADGPVGDFLGRGATPVRLPHQLPIYLARDSFLPTSGEVGDFGAPLAEYRVFDDVVVAPEFERYLVVAWGDRVFDDRDQYVGYNCDYTAFRKLRGSGDGLLWVNHEYVSFPLSLGAPETPATLQAAHPMTSFPAVVGFDIDGPTVPQGTRWGEFLYNMGGTIVRLRKDHNGRYAPVADRRNRRLTGLSGLALNAGRSDLRPDGTPFSSLTSWGDRPHQQGDQRYLIGTGPAATDVMPRSSDGLGNRIIGTGFGCSGALTPWGTVLSCEENFQGGAGAFFVGVQENVLPDGTQTGYVVGTPPTFTDPVSGQTFLNYTTGTFFGLVGEKYGWVVEIDPADPSWRARKHTAMGRVRHENVAMRAVPGRRLVAYMGDDRRGGHIWKYVSDGKVGDLKSRGNSRLLERGTLYVARMNPGKTSGTGEWIPLVPDTPVDPIKPSDLAAEEAAERGVPVETITAAKIRLPKRAGVAGQTSDGGPFDVTIANEDDALASYRTKGGTVASATLGDYYASQGAILVDAFLAGNLAGGTPAARPEDLEVNPHHKREVFISYTDGAPGSDGYPDSRVFVVGKYTPEVDDTQQFGGLYKIREDSNDSTGTTFRWERFEQSGESGAEDGDGFANLDNLAFDEDGNVWGVTDMSTGLHNGLGIVYEGATLQPTQLVIDHTATGSSAGNLVGTFGTNWIFYVPVRGRAAGVVHPFGYGPPRCEMTGPTFVGDTLFLAVQHPSEDSPINGDPAAGGPPASIITRPIEMLDVAGGLYSQVRTVPRGSNWPNNGPAEPPKPSVIGIRRVGRR
jgi:secreted PhoX family phosphatase